MSLEKISSQKSELIQIMIIEQKDKITDINKRIDDTTIEFREASAQGDRSENAAFTEAKNNLSLYNISLAQAEAKLSALTSLKEEEEKYRNIGIIKPYSTVRIVQLGSNKDFIIKIYPVGVSDVTRGIIDVASPLGSALLNKKVGDVVTTEHRTKNEEIDFKVEEIY